MKIVLIKYRKERGENDTIILEIKNKLQNK